MIYKHGKEIKNVYNKNILISEIRYGLQLIYQAIKSCFGRGYWIDTAIWSDSDVWKN